MAGMTVRVRRSERARRGATLAIAAITLVACSGDDQPTAATAVQTPSTPPAVSTPASTSTPTGTDSSTGSSGDTGTATGSGVGGSTVPGDGGTVTDGDGTNDGGSTGGGNGSGNGGSGNDQGGEDTTPEPGTWKQVTSLPSEAYPALSGANWSGDASPPLPDDASQLAPGMYRASRTGDLTTTDAISFAVQGFARCTDVPDACVTFDGEEIAPEDITPSGPVIPATIPLDASVSVGVNGVDCQADNQVASGAELAAMMRQLDSDYRAVIATAGAAVANEDFPALTTALLDSPSGHFQLPECFSGAFSEGTIRWRGDAGPGVLIQFPMVPDDAGGSKVPESPSAAWIRLAAIGVDASGTRTLYFDAGIQI